MDDLVNKFLKLNRARKINIYVLGDSVIDEYVDVKVNRISPEFPMPIMTSSNKDVICKPGGASNVVHQFRHLNVNHLLFTISDKKSEIVFKNNGINYCSLNSLNNKHFIPRKRRFFDNGIQVMRHDTEFPCCGLSEYEAETVLVERLKKISDLPYPDVAIFSDYGKGFFTSECFRIKDVFPGVTTIVDPKFGPLSKWEGCTVFKPNAKEAAHLSGYSEWKDQSRFLKDKLNCESVVITHGGEKVAGIWNDEFFCYTPTKNIITESVIGAGDCFASFFATAIGHGFSVPEAVEIAWNAGAVYVQRRLNEPVCPAELVANSIVDPVDLANRNFKLVFTNGCFDILHEGHLKTLEFAKSKGDKLVVALNSDASVKRLKGEKRPICPLEQRMKIMSQLKMVDFVVSFDEDTPFEVIKLIRPDVLVKGSDYSVTEIVGADLVPEVYRAPIVPGLSTTNLLAAAL